MRNERILEIAKRHQDALIGDGNELIGYEFSVASIITFARAVMAEQMECDAKICDKQASTNEGFMTAMWVVSDAIRNQKVEG